MLIISVFTNFQAFASIFCKCSKSYLLISSLQQCRLKYASMSILGDKRLKKTLLQRKG